jgi:hypothetical protein
MIDAMIAMAIPTAKPMTEGSKNANNPFKGSFTSIFM